MLTRLLHPRLLVGLAVAAAVGVTVVGVTGTGASDTKGRLGEDELARYEQAFLSVARHVGGVIEVGSEGTPSMKKAIGAVERGELRGGDLRRAAQAWVEALDRLEENARGLVVPDALASSHRGFLSSIRSYGHLARTLGEAAGTDDPDAIDATLDRAVALGTRGDEQFDAAAAAIQNARRELGLGASPDLPDRDRPLPDGVEIYDPDELYPEDF